MIFDPQTLKVTMVTGMKWKLTVLVLLMISGSAVAQVPAATIPKFKFARQDKSYFTNKQLATGKKLFFIFFDTECDHCRHAINFLNSRHTELNNAAVYLLTLDDPAKTRAFLKQQAPNLVTKKNVTILRDHQNEFINKFKPRKYPSLFLYSADKKLILYEDDEKQLPVFLKHIKAKV